MNAPMTRVLMTMALTLSTAGSALAFTENTFGLVRTYAYGGSLGFPGAWTTDADSGTGTIEAETGVRWWDCAPACEIGPGTGVSWAYARGNPQAGELRAAAGARNLSTSVAAWDASTPFGTFHVVPPHWGESYTETYLRSVWRIDATGDRLAVGDPVQVTAHLQLDGLIDNPPDSGFAAALLLNTQGDAQWIGATEFVPLHTVRDMIGMGRTFNYLLREGSTAGPVNLDEPLSLTFHVGDMLVLESMLDVDAGAPNDGNPKEVWSRFDATLRSTIQVNTPGAILVAVPEPETWAMLAAGLGLLTIATTRRGNRIIA
ncbi:MAG: PEP-CTERM sorting domain-containing protein [Burkholderiales bacterium]